MAEFEVVLMATTASSDASRSAATSPRPTEISEDENLGHMTGEGSVNTPQAALLN